MSEKRGWQAYGKAPARPRNPHCRKPINGRAPRKAHNHAEKRTCYYFFQKTEKYIVDNSITYKNHKQKPEKTCKDHLTNPKKVLLYF